MPIPSGVDQKKSRVYIEKTAGDYIQILPEIYCEPEILEDSRYPVSSYALKQYFNDLEGRVAPFTGATSTTPGNSGTVPAAEPGDRNSFLRGDGTWTKIAITDDKVKCILNKEKKFYLIGTEIADTNTGQATFDTGIFATENRGELQATHFIGDLTGNVVGDLEGTAKRAKFDADGNEISTFYTQASQLANYAPLVHQHSSKDITSLNGYVKGSSSTQISDDDTLNAALGKLEHRLDISATLESPHLAGIPTTPTPGSNSSLDQIANKEYVDNRISDLIGGAAETLDTLKEIESALGNDPNFAATMTTKLGTKLDKTSANYVKTLSISDNTAGTGQILKVQRGDDTSYTINIKDTVIQPATAAPLAPQAQAKAGTSLKYAREDHVHPLQDTTVANATNAVAAQHADKLTTARQLRANLATTAAATFDGTANQLNIPVAGILPVANGGTGASNLNGLVQTGAVNQTIAGTKTFSSTIAGSINGNAATATTATKVQGASSGTSWVAGAQAGKSLVNSTTTGYGTIFNAPTKGYRVALGTYPSNDNLVYLYSITNANVSAGTNTKAKQLTWNAETGELSANSFKGTLSGSSTSCTGNAATASKLGTATVGSGTKPIYLNGGTATASGSTVGSASKPVYMNGGTITACSSTVGSTTKPVYMNAGTIAASNANVGGAAKPMYLKAGVMTACSSTVGSTTKPVYMNAGTIAASNANVGNATTPMYLKAGVMTACNSSISSIYTLATTWSSNGSKTISGCTVGIPVILMHSVSSNHANDWCGVQVTSGAKLNGWRYTLGTDKDAEDGEDGYDSHIVLIPTATSIVVNITQIGNCRILVYKRS